jgi:two-component system KDP operon response regulator KdpE
MGDSLKIVVIDDEPAIGKLIRMAYDNQASEVLVALTGGEGMQLVAKSNPDVVLLDLGLPDIDGQEVCRKLREWTQVPIIVLSARGQEQDKVTALDNQADDYVTKPFGTAELQARVRTAMRHASRRDAGETETTFDSNGLFVDLKTRLVKLDGNEVHLTPIEYKLLAALVRHAGLVLTHRQLLETVWGPAYVDELHYLRVYMGQLRHKLETDPARPKLIRTETGIGYRLLSEG